MTDSAQNMQSILAQLVRAQLPRDAMREAFTFLLSGKASPEQIGGFICALATRGEAVDDVIAGVSVLLEHASPITAPESALDIVGTGGDGIGTWNISTAAALVVAGAGFPVAKHGNVAVSSKSGAAEILTQCGVNLDSDLRHVQAALDEAGICFLMAQRHHPVMRHVAPIRATLGFRSIFNMIGPLANPARVKHFMLGVFSADLMMPYAEALRALGAMNAVIVHGSDGLDEATTTGKTAALRLTDDTITRMEFHPSDIGLETARLDDLRGGTPQENADALKAILGGAKNAYRDIAIFNAAIALYGAGHCADLTDAARLATASLDEGRAQEKLNQLIAITNRDAAT